MFFKKKEAEKVQNQSAPQENNATVAAQNASSGNASSGNTKEAAAPLYQKPVLRRYDQIDQVKPYGPSEI